MTEQPPEYMVDTNGQLEGLPLKALKLANRVIQLAEEGKGKHRIEFHITRQGRWLISIDDGVIEDLGIN